MLLRSSGVQKAADSSGRERKQEDHAKQPAKPRSEERGRPAPAGLPTPGPRTPAASTPGRTRVSSRQVSPLHVQRSVSGAKPGRPGIRYEPPDLPLLTGQLRRYRTPVAVGEAGVRSVHSCIGFAQEDPSGLAVAERVEQDRVADHAAVSNDDIAV